MVGFDIGADGIPANVRTLSSDGNAALDRASVAAIAKSRFVAQARASCSYPYYRRQTTPIAAPSLPPLQPFKPAGATCDDTIRWSKLPQAQYPEAFKRRSVEGWAILRYDAEPSGAVANVEVLASEPSPEFGVVAKQVIAEARHPANAARAIGCVRPLRFRISDGSTQSTPEAR